MDLRERLLPPPIPADWWTELRQQHAIWMRQVFASHRIGDYALTLADPRVFDAIRCKQSLSFRTFLSRRVLPARSALPQSPVRTSGTHFCRSIAVQSRSEEHTSELQSLMRLSYAVFCFKKKTKETPI